MDRLKTIGLIIGLFLSSMYGLSQKYQFTRYNIEDGLCHNFIYTIVQSENGYLWLGTGEELCSFNGVEFANPYEKDTLSSGYVSCSYKDRSKDIWLGYNDGSITRYNGNQFIDYSIDSINSMINSIMQAQDGSLFIATQNDGIIHVVNDKIKKVYTRHLDNKILNTLIPLSPRKVLLGTNEGLYVYTFDNEQSSLRLLEPLASSTIKTIEPGHRDHFYFIGTTEKGIFTLTRRNEKNLVVDSISLDGYDFQNLDIEDICQTEDSSLWLGTMGKGAYKIPWNSNEKSYTKVCHYTKDNGLGSQFIKCIYEDFEGNIWLGTYGQGLSMLKDQAFVFHHFQNEVIQNNIHSVYEDSNRLWIGGVKGLMKIEKGPDPDTVIYDEESGLPSVKVTSLYKDVKERLWIGTRQNGIYRLDIGSNAINRVHYKSNSLGNSIHKITGSDQNVLVATKNGIYRYDISRQKTAHYTTLQGLPHNDINDIYLTESGKWLYATKSNGILSLSGDPTFKIAHSVKLEFTCITEDREGNIWAGTYGNGVFKFEADTLMVFNAEDGLNSNYCYSIVADDSNRIWVGHHDGLTRISPHYHFKLYGHEKGFKGDCNPLATFSNKKLYWGTTDGLITYDIRKDEKNASPPKTSIQSIRINDTRRTSIEKIHLGYDRYKLRFNFIGVDFKAPQKVKYQYKLKGFEKDWSDLTSSRYAEYKNIRDGEYVFLLRACNENHICLSKPVEVPVKIAIPFWKSWWFIVLSILAGIGIVIMIIKYRERKQRKFQEYLQNLLDERTAEVTKQKEELERKNKDITESIVYAQRIQNSMLPTITMVNQIFADAFIYYSPRDIVSGDFYWFQNSKSGKYIVVCADCTGHGVPGSLLSMIGITLLKDITAIRNIHSPGALLQELQKEFSITINGNYGVTDTDRSSNDGMDISVCEIDVNNLVVKMAGAMRPVLISTKDGLVHFKGTKIPIGGLENKLGQETGDVRKVFDEEEIQLEHGDAIYMLSDGYVDQFGGEADKKFMMGRLKRCIAEVYHMSMPEQKKYFEDTFNKWKGQNHQIDDVLLMGIRL